MLNIGVLISSLISYIWSFYPLSQYGILDKYQGFLPDTIHDLLVNPSSIIQIPSTNKMGVSYSFRKQRIYTFIEINYKTKEYLETLSFLKILNLRPSLSVGIGGDIGCERNIVEIYWVDSLYKKSIFQNFYWNLRGLLGIKLNRTTSLGFSFSISEAPFYSQFNDFPLIPIRFKNENESLSFTLGVRRNFSSYSVNIFYNRFLGKYVTYIDFIDNFYALTNDEISIVLTGKKLRVFGTSYTSIYSEETPYYQKQIKGRTLRPSLTAGISVEDAGNIYKLFLLFMMNTSKIEKRKLVREFLNLLFSIGGSLKILKDRLHFFLGIDLVSRANSSSGINLFGTGYSQFPVWTFPLINLKESGFHLTLGIRLNLLKYFSIQIGSLDITNSKCQKIPNWIFLLKANI